MAVRGKSGGQVPCTENQNNQGKISTEITEETNKNCYDAVEDDERYKAIHWCKDIGIAEHPDWYPGLTPDTNLMDIQANSAERGKAECLIPCPTKDTDKRPIPRKRVDQTSDKQLQRSKEQELANMEAGHLRDLKSTFEKLLGRLTEPPRPEEERVRKQVGDLEDLKSISEKPLGRLTVPPRLEVVQAIKAREEERVRKQTGHR